MPGMLSISMCNYACRLPHSVLLCKVTRHKARLVVCALRRELRQHVLGPALWDDCSTDSIFQGALQALVRLSKAARCRLSRASAGSWA